MFPPEMIEQVANLIRKKMADDLMRSITTQKTTETQNAVQDASQV